MASQGCTASGEEIHPAELTLGLDIDFTALGQLQGNKTKHRNMVVKTGTKT